MWQKTTHSLYHHKRFFYSFHFPSKSCNRTSRGRHLATSSQSSERRGNKWDTQRSAHRICHHSLPAAAVLATRSGAGSSLPIYNLWQNSQVGTATEVALGRTCGSLMAIKRWPVVAGYCIVRGGHLPWRFTGPWRVAVPFPLKSEDETPPHPPVTKKEPVIFKSGG